MGGPEPNQKSETPTTEDASREFTEFTVKVDSFFSWVNKIIHWSCSCSSCEICNDERAAMELRELKSRILYLDQEYPFPEIIMMLKAIEHVLDVRASTYKEERTKFRQQTGQTPQNHRDGQQEKIVQDILQNLPTENKEKISAAMREIERKKREDQASKDELFIDSIINNYTVPVSLRDQQDDQRKTVGQKAKENREAHDKRDQEKREREQEKARRKEERRNNRAKKMEDHNRRKEQTKLRAEQTRQREEQKKLREEQRKLDEASCGCDAFLDDLILAIGLDQGLNLDKTEIKVFVEHPNGTIEEVRTIDPKVQSQSQTQSTSKSQTRTRQIPISFGGQPMGGPPFVSQPIQTSTPAQDDVLRQRRGAVEKKNSNKKKEEKRKDEKEERKKVRQTARKFPDNPQTPQPVFGRIVHSSTTNAPSIGRIVHSSVSGKTSHPRPLSKAEPVKYQKIETRTNNEQQRRNCACPYTGCPGGHGKVIRPIQSQLGGLNQVQAQSRSPAQTQAQHKKIQTMPFQYFCTCSDGNLCMLASHNTKSRKAKRSEPTPLPVPTPLPEPISPLTAAFFSSASNNLEKTRPQPNPLVGQNTYQLFSGGVSTSNTQTIPILVKESVSSSQPKASNTSTRMSPMDRLLKVLRSKFEVFPKVIADDFYSRFEMVVKARPFPKDNISLSDVSAILNFVCPEMDENCRDTVALGITEVFRQFKYAWFSGRI